MSALPNAKKLRNFRSRVLRWFKTHQRSFPWRNTRDPYCILVSEVMLQQTQTDRVVPFYERFLRRFPNVQVLAASRARDVLAIWQGLGYNRRALSLHKAAQEICKRCDGRVPSDPELLVSLPGVGPYTARAVGAFAFGLSSAFIETNIRTVFLHEFFPRADGVSDAALLQLVEATLSRRDPGTWYWALMDYGAWLKKTATNSNVRSKHYRKQSSFAGSLRQLRGKILRCLLQRDSLDLPTLVKVLEESSPRVTNALQALAEDGFLRSRGSGVHRKWQIVS